MKVGMIGFGRFGKLWAEALSSFAMVKVYDTHLNLASKLKQDAIQFTSLEEAVHSDLVFLLVPISELEGCCHSILPYLNSHTIVVDCCSVKIYPARIMQSVFPQTQPLIATHPLFGPDSIKRSGGFHGHKIVLCPLRTQPGHEQKLEFLLKQLGLEIFITTPEEHDRQMAHSQGLVHLIGRGLASLHLKPQPLATPDFQALLNINQMVVHDTWQLFLDMHRYNPFTAPLRQKFIEQLKQLEEEINMITTDQPPIIEQTQPSLEQLREKINQLDASIIEKLAERQKVSKEVGELKAKTGRAVLDSKREEQLMQYYEELSQRYKLDPKFVKSIFKMIISQSRQVQTLNSMGKKEGGSL